MPRVDPAEFTALPLRGFALVKGFPLHDVWRVAIPGRAPTTIPELRARLAETSATSLPWLVRGLFALRAWLGRVLSLDGGEREGRADRVVRPERTPDDLAALSVVPPGTPEGPFTTLYVLPDEAAYEVRNATVHALLIVALSDGGASQRLYWGTWVAPVGRITALYMGLIDPFRHWIVYPGLERWLIRQLEAG